MSKPGIRILLVLTAAIALGALAQNYRFDVWIAAERSAGAALDRDTATSGEALNPNLNLNDEAAVAARAESQQTIDRRIVQLSRVRLAMNGVALIFVLGVAVYFGRVVTVLQARGEPTTAQMLRDLPPPVKPGVAAAHAGHAGPVAPVGPVAPAGSSRPTSLATAAELCVDLARVIDAAEVPALLERTAMVLGARGLVLWAIDPDGARLRPSLSYGYSDKVLAKLRSLQVDADNVTALAFRTLQPQVLNGAATGDPAAIAIPLLTATGCVGVMAAELRQNRPHADLLPVARIIGAQFSTLVTPAEVPRRSAQA